MSSLFSLNFADLIKGAIVALLTAIISAILPLLQSGVLPNLIQLQVAGVAGLTAFLAYLLKNFLSNSNGEVAKAEPKQ